MEAPFFSIVTVTLSARSAVERTARSILDQSFTDFEYIVKDGCSTDGTVERLTGLGRLHVVSQPDRGVYDAMNQALAHCRGRYVCFMNAGDVFADATCLAAVAETVQRHAYPDFVYGDVLSLDGSPAPDDPASVAAGRLVRYRGRLTPFYLYRRMICHQVWFVERGIYERLHRFDTRFRISAAYDFLLRMILDAQVRYAHVPRVIAVYEGGGLSSVDRPEKREERQLILRRHFSAFERMVFGSAYCLLRFPVALLRVTALRWMSPQLRGRVLGF